MARTTIDTGRIPARLWRDLCSLATDFADDSIAKLVLYALHTDGDNGPVNDLGLMLDLHAAIAERISAEHASTNRMLIDHPSAETAILKRTGGWMDRVCGVQARLSRLMAKVANEHAAAVAQGREVPTTMDAAPATAVMQ